MGRGGFGKVFEATNHAGDRAAAKLVRKGAGAQRELTFVDLAGARNVIPILDNGKIEAAGGHASSLPAGEYFVLILIWK